MTKVSCLLSLFIYDIENSVLSAYYLSSQWVLLEVIPFFFPGRVRGPYNDFTFW